MALKHHTHTHAHTHAHTHTHSHSHTHTSLPTIGATLDTVMTGEAGTLTMDEGGAQEGAAGGNRPRSDSDIARELQAAIDGGTDDAMSVAATTGTGSTISTPSAGTAPEALRVDEFAVDLSALQSMMDMGLEESHCM